MKIWQWALASVLILFGVSEAASQQQRLVTGKVYSYVLNGIIHYTAQPPSAGSERQRTINYSYIETTKSDPAGKPLYKCSDNGVPLYTATPSAGCVVVGIYRPSPAFVPQYAPTFHGIPCTYDYSGHEAGYQWAQRHGIDDPDDCSGRSSSFIEGCEAYGEEQQSDMIESGECSDHDNDVRCD